MGGGRNTKDSKGSSKGKSSKGKSEKGKNKGEGKGKGSRNKEHNSDLGGKDSKSKPAASVEATTEKPGQSSDTTKALVEALRAFSAPHWWLIGKGEDETDEASHRKRSKPDEFQKLCEERHAEMKKVYESAMAQDSEQRWLRKVSHEGTSGDKVASLTMLIQVCPVFATSSLKALLNMAGRTARSDSMMAVDALKELFVNNLLPDRKLKTLQQMVPISPKGLKKSTFTELCVVSYFEDFLKTAFAAFVQILSEAGHNSVVFIKTKAIRTAYELLAAKPEQEKALLALLINKFGDSSPKVSSNVSFLIKQLLQEHPGMKIPVVREVEAFLIRPNITKKSQYFAILLLSEMLLGRSEGALASELVRLFVARLEVALQKPPNKKEADKGKRKKWWLKKAPKKRGITEEDNRLVRTLINGIRRAMPYIDGIGGSPLGEETVNALFKVCHIVSSFSTRISILGLLYHGLASGDPPDRFYRLLYEQVAQFELFSSMHRWQACLLLNRCVPADLSVSRAAAMTRRALQVGAHSEPAVAVAALGVLRELTKARRPEIKPLLNSVEKTFVAPLDVEVGDAEEEHFIDDDVAQGTDASLKQKEEDKCEHYQPFCRDPRFSRARQTPLWELSALASHIHPFVVHGASKLLTAESFDDHAGNPFEVFSVGELLEQFTYSAKPHKDHSAKRPNQKVPEVPHVPLNSEKFANKKNVAPHEKFFQLYFQDNIIRERQERKAKARDEDEEDFDEQRAEGGEIDDEDGADRFFDDYLQGEGADADVDDDEDGDADEDGEEDLDDPDLDDESVDDPGDCSEDGEDAEEGDPDEDASEDMSEDEPKRGKKRSAKDAALSRSDKIKALKKRHASSMFASVEDFQQLLDEDDALH